MNAVKSLFAAALVVAAGGTASMEAAAQQFPRLGCNVNSGTTTVGTCSASQASFSPYKIAALPVGGSGNYAYSSWQVAATSGPAPTTVSGCSNTSSNCVVQVPSSSEDKEGTFSVVITDLGSGGQTTSTVNYFVGAVCNQNPPTGGTPPQSPNPAKPVFC